MSFKSNPADDDATAADEQPESVPTPSDDSPMPVEDLSEPVRPTEPVAPPPVEQPPAAEPPAAEPVAEVELLAPAPAQDPPEPEAANDAAAEPAPAAEPVATGGGASVARRLLVIGLVAAIFGVAGYLIRPRIAGSAPVRDDAALLAARAELAEVRAAREKLHEQLASAAEELEAVRAESASLAEAERAAGERAEAAEAFVARLTRELKEAKTAGAPMREKLDEARKRAEGRTADAEEAAARAQKLQEELAAVTSRREALSKERDELAGRKSELEKALSARKAAEAELRRLLAALELGPPPSAPASAAGSDGPSEAADGPAAPAEMPLTEREVSECLGYPTMAFHRCGEVALRWGTAHTARSVGGLVTTIDGRPAGRALLAELSGARPSVGSAPGPWRLSDRRRVHYAELVDLFGQPERMAGTGRRFTAWWSIGAWARRASATVADGVVTSFDGRPVDPPVLCALVRHRPQAYREPEAPAVRAAVDAARACYERAAETVVPDRLRRDAVTKSRDGIRLAAWRLAPLESVGTWIAPTNAPAGSMTLRAALTCTWARGDGSAETDARYVVVTLTARGERIRTTECVVLPARD